MSFTCKNCLCFPILRGKKILFLEMVEGWCPRADAIDREEKTLNTCDKEDSLKKMKITWGAFLFRRDL